MSKKLLSLQLDLDDFIPATDEEKKYMVQMRQSTTFFRDGVKRLLKKKVASARCILLVLLTLLSIILPMIWPYSYDAMLGVSPANR